MPNNVNSTGVKAAFYHSLGKVLTLDTNLVGNENYKSAHNVRSREVWMDSIPYSPSYASASQYSDDIIVRQIGTGSNPAYVYPLMNTNYQTWFIDTGTPSAYVDGFFSYLSSQVLNCHDFIHGLNFYGSFNAIKNDFYYNVIDDLDYLEDTQFFINNKGFIVTCAHVISNSKIIICEIHPKREKYPCKLIGFSPDYDIALLKIYGYKRD